MLLRIEYALADDVARSNEAADVENLKTAITGVADSVGNRAGLCRHVDAHLVGVDDDHLPRMVEPVEVAQQRVAVAAK